MGSSGAVFRGLRRDHGEAGGFAYVRKPPFAFHSDGRRRRDPWPNEVFAVFVTSDRVAFHWDWLEADAEEPTLPLDWRARFEERVQ